MPYGTVKSAAISWYDLDEHPSFDRLSIDIEEAEPRHRDTGILDADGNKIFYYERREPIGFYRLGIDD